MRIVLTQEVRSNSELQNVTLASRRLVLSIPIARNVNRVFFVHHWVEEGLSRQARRESAKSAGADQFQFFPAHWAI
jgi:hypothetical protein